MLQKDIYDEPTCVVLYCIVILMCCNLASFRVSIPPFRLDRYL